MDEQDKKIIREARSRLNMPVEFATDEQILEFCQNTLFGASLLVKLTFDELLDDMIELARVHYVDFFEYVNKTKEF